MFSNISWGTYLGVTFSITAAYYVVIGLIYYKEEMRRFILSKKQVSKRGNSEISSVLNASRDREQVNHTVSEENNFLFQVADALVFDLKLIINKAAKNRFVKEELVTSLKLKIKENLQLKGTAFQVAINNSIQKESESQCSICLNENELKLLWLE